MPSRQDRRRQTPALQPLEARLLLTAASQAAAQQARAQRLDDAYVGFLRTIELHSQATPAEYLALRDDALAISQAASTTGLAQSAANARADAVSVQIDRAFLDGFLDDSGWQQIEARMEANLNGLDVPQSVIDRTISDMKAAAQSAGLSAGAYADLAAKADQLRQAEVALPSGAKHFDDPQLYYTQHLRGFIRGGTVAKDQARATLQADVNAIAPGNAVVKRDVALLQQVGSRVSVAANQEIAGAYHAAFAAGAPDEAAISGLGASLRLAVGTTAQPRSTEVAIGRLVADAPAFFGAAGSSATDVDTLLKDIDAYLAAGGSAPINPFRVQVVRSPTSPSA